MPRMASSSGPGPSPRASHWSDRRRSRSSRRCNASTRCSGGWGDDRLAALVEHVDLADVPADVDDDRGHLAGVRVGVVEVDRLDFQRANGGRAGLALSLILLSVYECLNGVELCTDRDGLQLEVARWIGPELVEDGVVTSSSQPLPRWSRRRSTRSSRRWLSVPSIPLETMCWRRRRRICVVVGTRRHRGQQEVPVARKVNPS